MTCRIENFPDRSAIFPAKPILVFKNKIATMIAIDFFSREIADRYLVGDQRSLFINITGSQLENNLSNRYNRSYQPPQPTDIPSRRNPFFRDWTESNPGPIRAPMYQFSGTEPAVRPDWDPPTPCLGQNSWRFLHNRGSGYHFTSDWSSSHDDKMGDPGDLRLRGEDLLRKIPFSPTFPLSNHQILSILPEKNRS